MRLRSVVLPEPKKPVSTVTGVRVSSVTTDTSRAPPRVKTPGQPMRIERGGIRKGDRQREPRVAGPFVLARTDRNHSNVPIAHRDVRNIIARPVSGLTSAFKSC